MESEHLKNIFADNELDQASVIRNFRITDALGGDGSPRDGGPADYSALSVNFI
jgi:hypothetical protein